MPQLIPFGIRQLLRCERLGRVSDRPKVRSPPGLAAFSASFVVERLFLYKPIAPANMRCPDGTRRMPISDAHLAAADTNSMWLQSDAPVPAWSGDSILLGYSTTPLFSGSVS